VLNELFHGTVSNIGEETLPEKGVHPLVQGVSACVDRRLFNWIALSIGEGLEPNFGLLFERDAGGCFDKRLCRIDTEFLELLGRGTFCDGAMDSD
jgi:hypothetical protein